MELQWQIQHLDPHMNLGDTIQIEAPDFNPDIDDVSPTTTDQESNNIVMGKPVTTAFISDDVRIPTETY